MSNFSTLFDQLIGTTIPGITGFSTKTKIPNPYSLADNDINLKRNGWGLIIGECSESTEQEFCFERYNQVISIILTREVKATMNNPTPLESATKNLREDCVLLKLDFLNPDQLAIDANIEKIDYISTSAIEWEDLEESNILHTTITFNFQIKESI